MRPVRFLVSLAFLAVTIGLVPANASAPATAQIKLTPTVGPPTSKVKVSGRGFGASETVDVSFDTTPVATAMTDPTGAFTARFKALRSATPGSHTVTATAQSSGLSAQASFLVRTDWPMSGFGPAHLGYNRFENVIGPSNAANLTEAWTLHTGGSVSSAVVVGGLVYAGSTDGYLYALDAATGGQVWAAHVGSVEVNTPAVVKGVAYVQVQDAGYFTSYHALVARTGRQLWRSPETGVGTGNSPVVANGAVYVTGSFGLLALAASTGAVLWSFHVASYSLTQPAVANGVVYASADGAWVYAVDAATGAKLWSFHGCCFVTSPPAVANGVVYVGDDHAIMYALDAATGRTKWSVDVGGGWAPSRVAVVGRVLYLGTEDGTILALNAATGAECWSFATGGIVPTYSAPSVANGVLYIGTGNDNIYALNASTGAELWSFTTGDHAYASPVVANGAVYEGSLDDNLYAFDVP